MKQFCLVLLFLLVISVQAASQAQTPARTKAQSSTPPTSQAQGVKAQVAACFSPKSPECLEARINELTNRTAALEGELERVRNLLRDVDEEMQKDQNDKGDLAGTIKSIWAAIKELQQRTGILPGR